MGQAKNRGTFEERQAAALARNQAVEKQVAETRKHELKTAHARLGTRGLVRLLMAGGAMAYPSDKRNT